MGKQWILIEIRLGSIESSKLSCHQLAFLLLLMDFINLNQPVKVSAFDPAFTDLDHSVLIYFGIEIIEKNEKCIKTVTTQTLFYMPHWYN